MENNSDKRRLKLSFDMANERERIVYNYLNELGYGKKTEAVVRAVCLLADWAKEQMQNNEAETNNLNEEVFQQTIQDCVSQTLTQMLPKLADMVSEKVSASVGQQEIKTIRMDKKPEENFMSNDLDAADIETLKLAQMFGGK